MKESKPDELGAKLGKCKVNPRLPASFQREVWQRIAARRAVREGAFWPQAVRWFLVQVARPRYAMALVW